LTLSVGAGEVLAVLGPNGAGKTTFLNGVVGLAQVTAGQVRLHGADITGVSPEQAAARGIAYVPQGRWLFAYATGSMNVWSGGYPRKDRGEVDADTRRFFAESDAARPLARRRGGVMSGGQQQLVAIGRGLTARPSLLLLDEPSLGLAPIAIGSVFTKIAEVAAGLARTGGAVVLVEQNVTAALNIAHRVCVLSGGAIIHEAAAADVSRAQLAALYLL